MSRQFFYFNRFFAEASLLKARKKVGNNRYDEIVAVGCLHFRLRRGRVAAAAATAAAITALVDVLPVERRLVAQRRLVEVVVVNVVVLAYDQVEEARVSRSVAFGRRPLTAATRAMRLRLLR